MKNKDFKLELKKYRNRLENLSFCSEGGISNKAADKIRDYVLNPSNMEELECANGYLTYIEEVDSMVSSYQEDFFANAFGIFSAMLSADEDEKDVEETIDINENADYVNYAKQIYNLKKKNSASILEKISEFVTTPEQFATIMYQSCKVPSDELETIFDIKFGIKEDDSHLASTINDIKDISFSLQDNFFGDIKNVIAYFNKFDELFKADEQKSNDNSQYSKK